MKYKKESGKDGGGFCLINGGMVGELPFAGVEKGLLVVDCDTIAYFVVEFGAVGENSKGLWRRGEICV